MGRQGDSGEGILLELVVLELVVVKCGYEGEQVVEGGAHLMPPRGAGDRSPRGDSGYESLQCPK